MDPAGQLLLHGIGDIGQHPGAHILKEALEGVDDHHQDREADQCRDGAARQNRVIHHHHVQGAADEQHVQYRTDAQDDDEHLSIVTDDVPQLAVTAPARHEHFHYLSTGLYTREPSFAPTGRAKMIQPRVPVMPHLVATARPCGYIPY